MLFRPKLSEAWITCDQQTSFTCSVVFDMFWRICLTLLAVSLLLCRCTTHGQSLSNNQRWIASGDGALPLVMTGTVAEPSFNGDNDGDDSVSYEDDSDEDGDYDQASGLSGTVHGSGYPSESPVTWMSSFDDHLPCLKLRDLKTLHENAYRPKCTENGEFEPMQCFELTSECWCVDANGNDVPNSMRRHPDMPKCYGDNAGNDANIQKPRDEDIDIIELSNSRLPHDSPTSGTGTEIFPGDMDDQPTEVKPVEGRKSIALILNQPLILAGLVGGAVFVILIIILILMFIVYRMRKKDEGSYSLDEPRQSFGYTRAKDQEFFA